ncbi:MAG TPA: pantoate--beta-alanine ligase [Planctomycetia bacterium]|nr:pantoate--beta-alanine ligase [Planctomycetia bacterium]
MEKSLRGPVTFVGPEEIRGWTLRERAAGRTVGLVPTMGDLHAGHRSLLERARADCDRVVATIFVNPLQFDSEADLAKYPRNLERDLDMAAAIGVDAVFAPPESGMYRKDASTVVEVQGLQDRLCGAHRPGHFRGVATVVAKLFNIVPAGIAYFGRKDYQQATLIARMVRDLDFPIEIRLCPTVRDADGLALSSRNARLSPAERAQAPVLHRMLAAIRDGVAAGERDAAALRERALRLLSEAPAARLDYLEIVAPDNLEPLARIAGAAVAAGAVRMGETRLIDNLEINA